MKKCRFCGNGIKVNANFYDYYKNSDMVAFTATMGIADTNYAKNSLEIQINLENAEITPNPHILPWEFMFDIHFCPMCGRQLYSKL